MRNESGIDNNILKFALSQVQTALYDSAQFWSKCILHTKV